MGQVPRTRGNGASPSPETPSACIELAIEDALNIHQQPKIERYDHDPPVVPPARYDDAAEEVEFGEISVFLTQGLFRDHGAVGVSSELERDIDQIEATVSPAP